MAVATRFATQQLGTSTSFTINYPSSMVTGEIILMWLVCKTGVQFNTPSGWTLINQDDTGGVNAALFYRTWNSPATSVTVTTTASTDVGYVTVTWNSLAAGKVLGFGQGGFSGSGTDPLDAGDTYVYSQYGKSDKDTTGDNTLGVYSGGILCPSDIACYFYALQGATISAAPSIGSEDTSLQSAAMAVTTTIRFGCITSTYRAGARGFTVTNTPTSVAYGTWLSENADTSLGGGPGGNGIPNPQPSTITYTAREGVGGFNRANDVEGNGSNAWTGYLPMSGSLKASSAVGNRQTPERGDTRGAIVPSSRDAVQPEQGSSISVT